MTGLLYTRTREVIFIEPSLYYLVHLYIIKITYTIYSWIFYDHNYVMCMYLETKDDAWGVTIMIHISTFRLCLCGNRVISTITLRHYMHHYMWANSCALNLGQFYFISLNNDTHIYLIHYLYILYYPKKDRKRDIYLSVVNMMNWPLELDGSRVLHISGTKTRLCKYSSPD